MFVPPTTLPTIKELLAKVDETVAGLEDSKRRVLVALRNHMSAALNERQHRVANLLVLGQTGGGKSKMVRACLEATGLPFVEGNATVYSEVGFIGQDLTNLFLGLEDDYERTSGVHRREYRRTLERWSVVLLDEIDKWHYAPNPKERQVGRGLQSELLKLAEGDTAWVRRSESDHPYAFNTHNVLFIGMGAFEDIEKYVMDDGQGHFSPHQDRREIMAKIKPEHIIRYGFMEEFVGRFSSIVALPPLTTPAMLRILMEQIWPAWEQRAIDEGIELRADESALRDVANHAAQERIGARALEPLLSNMTWEAWSQAEPGDCIHIDNHSASHGKAKLLKAVAA